MKTLNFPLRGRLQTLERLWQSGVAYLGWKFNARQMTCNATVYLIYETISGLFVSPKKCTYNTSFVIRLYLILLQEGVDELGWRHILDDVDLDALFPSGFDRTSLDEFFSAVRISNVSDTSVLAQRARKFFVRYCTELEAALIGKKTWYMRKRTYL